MAVDVSAREYRTIREAAGPLIVVSDVEGVSYGEVVKIISPSYLLFSYLVFFPNPNPSSFRMRSLIHINK